MGTKKTTKTTYSGTQTAAPPSWTMPGIQTASDQVISALEGMPGTPYQGNFVAQPNSTLVQQMLQGYQELNAGARSAGETVRNNASQLPQTVQTALGTNPFANINLPQAPTIPTAANFVAPTAVARPDLPTGVATTADLSGIARPDIEAGLRDYVQAEVLAAPDLADLRPDLQAGKPTAAVWDPTAWTGGQNDNGRLQAAIEAGIAPVMRQLMEQVLPSIRSSAIDAGAYTGDRAMQILPQQAMAEAATRGSEVGAGLSYEGFQRAQDRDLSAWQALESFRGQDANQDNSFNSNIYNTLTNALMQQFGIESDARMTGYQTQQGALLQNAGMANDFNTNRNSLLTTAMRDLYGIDVNAALTNAGMVNQFNSNQNNTLTNALTNMYGIDRTAANDTAAMQNTYNYNNRALDTNAGLDLFGRQSDNAIRTAADSSDYQTAAADVIARAFGMQTDMYGSGLALEAGGQDMLAQALGLQQGADQAAIDEALARYQYNLQAPFQGLDMAVPLLAALSGNYGTQTSQGQQTQVERTGGLGSVVQGIAGLAGMAASLGAFGPLGAAGTAAGGAGAASNVFKRAA